MSVRTVADYVATDPAPTFCAPEIYGVIRYTFAASLTMGPSGSNLRVPCLTLLLLPLPPWISSAK